MVIDSDRVVARKSFMGWIFIAVGHIQWIARAATVIRKVADPVSIRFWTGCPRWSLSENCEGGWFYISDPSILGLADCAPTPSPSR
jgi:hypothetical protein